MGDKIFYNGKEIDVPDIENMEYHSLTSRIMKIHYPKFYDYLNEKFPNISWSEKLYRFVHGTETPYVCELEGCNNFTKYRSFYQGYGRFCCKKHANKFNEEAYRQTCKELYGDEIYFRTADFQNKSKTTCNEKYGVDLYAKTEECKERSKQTNQLRYGVDNYSQTEECKEKTRQTCNERFGVDNPMQNQEIKDKLFQTYFENTGYKSPTQNPNVVNKITTTRRTKFMQEHDWLIDYTEEGEWICKCPHPNDCELWNECNHQYVITSIIQSNRLNDQIEVCTKRNPLGYCKSPWEQLIKRFLDNFKINYVSNIYSLIKNSRNNPIEIDIYLPTRKIGIEINGSYIHSLDCSSTEEFQHIEKHQKCLEKGIELIYIWGDWIRHNPSIVKEFLIDKLSNKPLLRYKSLWFPDLDDSQWPLDLGWYDNTPPNPDEIIPHYCKHGKSSDLHQCCDSGIIYITH